METGFDGVLGFGSGIWHCQDLRRLAHGFSKLTSHFEGAVLSGNRGLVLQEQSSGVQA